MHRTDTAPDAIASGFRIIVREGVMFSALIAIAGLAVAYLRYEVIENAALGRVCAGAAGDLRCTLQSTTILLFNSNAFGLTALAMAVATLLRPGLWLLTATAMMAVLGLILYNTSAAALALGLAILTFARPAPLSRLD